MNSRLPFSYEEGSKEGIKPTNNNQKYMKTIAEYKFQIAETKKKVEQFDLNFDKHIAPIVEGLKCNFFYIYPESNQIIASFKTRKEFAKIRHLVKGVWEKEVRVYSEEPVARYKAVAECGILLIAEVNELPPSCKLVEEVVAVPAVLAQPITQMIVRKVVCRDSSKVTSDQAKELSL